MSIWLAWRRSADDQRVHGWTRDRECGWPVALCGHTCSRGELAVCACGEPCLTCVREAAANGAPVPSRKAAKRLLRSQIRLLRRI